MKPVGLIGNSGGIVSSEPLSQLRIIVRSLLGIAVQHKLLHTTVIMLNWMMVPYT